MLSLSFSFINHLYKNPFARSLIIFGVIVMVSPWQPDAYRIEKTSQELAGSKSVYTYRDIDNDGNSDKLRFINFREKGFSSVVVYRNNRTLGQWNFKGTWNDHRPMFMVNDYDKDGLKEIFLFTYHLLPQDH